MNARAQRTRHQLEGAILALGRDRPLSAITVTDIARAAHITRPTFYAHAESPGDLLATVLGGELEKIRESFGRASDADEADEADVSADAPIERLGRALVAHVHHNIDVYRNNLGDASLTARLPREIRDVLIDHIEWGLNDHLLRHPHLAPAGAASEPKDAEFRYRQFAFYSAIAASSTVAALETWMRGGDPLDQEWAVQMIVRGNAEWWQATGAVSRRAQPRGPRSGRPGLPAQPTAAGGPTS